MKMRNGRKAKRKAESPFPQPEKKKWKKGLDRAGKQLVRDFLYPSLRDHRFGKWLHWEDESKGIFKVVMVHNGDDPSYVHMISAWDELKKPKRKVSLVRARENLRNAFNSVVKKNRLRILSVEKKKHLIKLPEFRESSEVHKVYQIPNINEVKQTYLSERQDPGSDMNDDGSSDLGYSSWESPQSLTLEERETPLPIHNELAEQEEPPPTQNTPTITCNLLVIVNNNNGNGENRLGAPIIVLPADGEITSSPTTNQILAGVFNMVSLGSLEHEFPAITVSSQVHHGLLPSTTIEEMETRQNHSPNLEFLVPPVTNQMSHEKMQAVNPEVIGTIQRQSAEQGCEALLVVNKVHRDQIPAIHVESTGAMECHSVESGLEAPPVINQIHHEQKQIIQAGDNRAIQCRSLEHGLAAALAVNQGRHEQMETISGEENGAVQWQFPVSGLSAGHTSTASPLTSKTHQEQANNYENPAVEQQPPDLDLSDEKLELKLFYDEDERFLEEETEGMETIRTDIIRQLDVDETQHLAIVPELDDKCNATFDSCNGVVIGEIGTVAGKMDFSTWKCNDSSISTLGFGEGVYQELLIENSDKLNEGTEKRSSFESLIKPIEENEQELSLDSLFKLIEGNEQGF